MPVGPHATAMRELILRVSHAVLIDLLFTEMTHAPGLIDAPSLLKLAYPGKTVKPEGNA